MKEITLPGALGPYSAAQIAGGFVFTSGQIGANPVTGEIPQDVEAQAENAFTNIANILKLAGTDISKAVRTTVFIKDMNDFAKINAVYAKHFSAPYPARSCVEVARLPKDVLVECECIAEI